MIAYPDAVIYEIAGSSINEVDYDKTEHCQTMRAFLIISKELIDILTEEDTED